MENLLDLKMPGVMELGGEELKEVDGGGAWYLVPFGWILTEIAMNPRTTANVFDSAAKDELAKIRAGY